MKWSIAILLGVLGALAQHPCDAAQSRYQRQDTEATPIANAFVSVFSEVKAKSRLAVLLPSELPQPVAKAEHAVVETASEDQYAISLYHELAVGDSGFAASFAANAHPNYGPKDIPNVNRVELSRGLIGYFRPISCGGSCAPANL